MLGPSRAVGHFMEMSTATAQRPQTMRFARVTSPAESQCLWAHRGAMPCRPDAGNTTSSVYPAIVHADVWICRAPARGVALSPRARSFSMFCNCGGGGLQRIKCL